MLNLKLDIIISVMASKKTYAETFNSGKILIGISGIIGAGKSTLTKNLADEMGCVPIYEPVKTNPYLEHFYVDQEKYGFAMQIFLLSHRFADHQRMVWSPTPSVQDRTIYEDLIFAKMLYESGKISELDFTTYRKLFSDMTNFLHRPDIIVYLDVDPQIAKQRILARGRDCEKDLPVEYLVKLREGYEEWLLDIGRRVPVLRLDWSEFIDPKLIAGQIKAMVPAISYPI